jgi:hypothetical protein
VAVNGTTINITKGGDFTVSGALSNGMICINTTEKVKLRLNGTSITNTSGPAIYVKNSKKVFISLEAGTMNYITDGASYSIEAKGAIFSNDSLEIKGSGSLSVKGNFKHGICSDESIKVESGTINISADKDGIHANNNVKVDGGTINITKANDGIESEGDLIVNAGTLNLTVADDGITATGDVTINGGTITVKDGQEGIESKANMTINGGNISLTVYDDGLNALKSIIINGGTNYFKVSQGDGIDSNVSITINGGITVALGTGAPECGIDCDNNTVVVNGGTLIAMGGSNSNASDSSKQCMLFWATIQLTQSLILQVKVAA